MIYFCCTENLSKEAFMKKEDILQFVQENHNDRVPDEMEKQEILKMGKVFSLAFVVIITITLLLNGIFNNSIAIAENAGIAFATMGIANYYLDNKQNKKRRKVVDIITICIGIFFYVGYISLLVSK